MKKLALIGLPTIGLFSIVAPISCGTHSEKPKTTSEFVSNKNTATNVFSGGVDRPKTIEELKKNVPNYYSSLKNDAKGEELFNELHSIQEKYYSSVGSYGDLWTIYHDSFKDNYDDKDGTLLDIYEEIPNKPDVHTLRLGIDQDHGADLDLNNPSSSEEGKAYNREHIVPESVFDIKTNGRYNQIIPSHNDAHFIFPTDRQGNAAHLNFPYDWVNEYTWKTTNGSAVGFNNETDSKFTAFEPIDAFKGDVARATLYFALTWRTSKYDIGNYNFKPFTSSKTFPVMTEHFKNVYKEWSKLDQVSQWDVDRDEVIARHEGGLRNPFTDMPELIDLIWQ